MTIADWLMILSVVAAPTIAVQVQKYLERFREDKAGRLSVFKTLMATRGAIVSSTHVQALNMIDLRIPSTVRITRMLQMPGRPTWTT